MDAVKDSTTGRLYKQEISLCGKERCKKCERGDGHGPYWYAYWWEGGRTRKKYIGKTLPASLTQDNLNKTAGEGGLPKTDEGVVERALEAIRGFHARGVEPSVSQIAEVVGAHPKHLGRWLKAEGLEAQNVRRGGERARRYTFELKERIEELLGGPP